MANEKRSFNERLHTALCKAFNLDELQILLNHKLVERLDNITHATSNFKVVVFELISWAQRRNLIERLLVAVANERPNCNELNQLREELGAPLSMPPQLATSVGHLNLPNNLLTEIESLASLPRVLNDSEEIYYAMGRAAERIRRIQLQTYQLTPRFCLSPSAAERTVGVLALQQTPDTQFLRWLAERVAVELPYTAFSAACALTEAALRLPSTNLGQVVRVCHDARPRTRSPLLNDYRDELEEINKIVMWRRRRMPRRVNLSFDECLLAFTSSLTLDELGNALKQRLGMLLEHLAPAHRGRAYCTYKVLNVATQVGWDNKLVIAARLAKPESNSLKTVFEAYDNVGLISVKDSIS